MVQGRHGAGDLIGRRGGLLGRPPRPGHVLLRADELRPQRVGLGDGAGGGDDAPRRRARLPRRRPRRLPRGLGEAVPLPRSPAASPTATPPCCGASPTSSSSTCSTSAAARPWAASPACSAIPASSASRRSSPARSPSASCPAPTRPKSFAAPTRRSSRGELEAARSVGMRPFLMFRRIVAPQVLRYAIPGLGNVWQLVLEGIGPDLGDGTRRASAPIGDRGRLHPPALLLLHHGGGALPPHHQRLDLGVPEGRGPTPCAASGGCDGPRLHGRDLPEAPRRGAADAQPRRRLRRLRGGAGDGARGPADVRRPRPRLDRPDVRLRVPRHAAPRPDLPDLLRPRPVPPDPSGLGLVGLLPRALLVRAHSRSRSTPEPTRARSSAAGCNRCRRARSRRRGPAA